MRLRAPAQQRCTHPVAQLLRRFGWRHRGGGMIAALGLHRGGGFLGLTRPEPRQLLGRQVLRLGVDHFGRRTITIPETLLATADEVIQ